MKKKDGGTQSGGDVSLPGSDTDTLQQDEAFATEAVSNIDPHHGNGGSYVINGDTQTREANVSAEPKQQPFDQENTK